MGRLFLINNSFLFTQLVMTHMLDKITAILGHILDGCITYIQHFRCSYESNDTGYLPVHPN